jgi:mono/diheme cytochrome c family protein
MNRSLASVAALAAVALVGAALATVPVVAQDKVDAAALYKSKCAVCHGANGNSTLPDMSFADGKWKHGTTVKELTEVITKGVPGTAMVSFSRQLKPDEIEGLARYVRTFDKNLK